MESTGFAVQEVTLATCFEMLRDQQRLLGQQGERIRALETNQIRLRDEIDRASKPRTAPLREAEQSPASTPLRGRSTSIKTTLNRSSSNAHIEDRTESQKRTDEALESKINNMIEPYITRLQDASTFFMQVESHDQKIKELTQALQSKSESLASFATSTQKLSDELRQLVDQSLDSKKAILGELTDIRAKLNQTQNFSIDAKDTLWTRITKLESTIHDQIYAKLSITLGDYVTCTHYMQDRATTLHDIGMKLDKSEFDAHHLQFSELMVRVHQLETRGIMDGATPDAYTFDRLNGIPYGEIYNLQARIAPGKLHLKHSNPLLPVASSPASSSPQYQLLHSIVERLEDLSCTFVSKVDQAEFDRFIKILYDQREIIEMFQLKTEESKLIEKEMEKIQLLLQMKQDKIAGKRISEEKLDKKDFEIYSKRIDDAIRNITATLNSRSTTPSHNTSSPIFHTPANITRKNSPCEEDIMTYEKASVGLSTELDQFLTPFERESSLLPGINSSQSALSRTRPSSRAKTPLQTISRPTSSNATHVFGFDGGVYVGEEDGADDAVVVRIEKALISKTSNSKASRIRAKGSHQ